jgi:CRP/FNR family transcriptional regulator, cyclic AMP receptor protein
VSTERVAALLGSTPLFADIDRDALNALARGAIRRTYERNESIFHRGDSAESLLVVAEGLVKIFIVSENGDEMVLATLQPPESFGELAVIDGGPRSASARAVEPTTLVALPRQAFLKALEEQPSLLEAIHLQLGGLLRRMLDQASDLVFLDLGGRVAKLLANLAAERGRPEGDGTLLDLQLSQSTLANMVGGSRPTVNQILKTFEARGYLEIRGRQVLITQLDQLSRRAGL